MFIIHKAIFKILYFSLKQIALSSDFYAKKGYGCLGLNMQQNYAVEVQHVNKIREFNLRSVFSSDLPVVD